MRKSGQFAFAAALFCGLSAQAEPTRVRIGYPATINGQIVAVLEQTPIAEAQSLNAEYIFFQNGPPMMEAMAAGQVDIALTSLIPFMTLKSRLPSAALVVAGLGVSSYALMAKGDAPAARLADLKGKKIGVSFGTDSHVDLLLSLEEAALKPGEVELLDIQPSELPLALERNLADAILVRQPQSGRLSASGSKTLHKWPYYFTSPASVFSKSNLKRSTASEKH